MPNIANKFKLGVFVVCTFILLCIILFLLGSLELFRPKIACMTVVTSSVQGLSVGAKVKYNGVGIGQVSGIKISPNGDNVYIYMDIFPDNFNKEDALGFENVNKFGKYLNTGIKRGLRCQLRYEGITGTLYQEMKYFNVKKNPVTKFKLPSSHPLYIPSVAPILMGDILSKINTSLEKLSGIDEVFVEVTRTVKGISKYLNGEKFTDLINHIDRISYNINNVTTRFNETLTKEKVENIVNEFEELMQEIKKLSENANKEIFEAKIPQTASDARNMMQTLVIKLEDAVNNFNETAESIKELSNTINNQPDSVIWGKKENKVVPSF
ncbi:MAG TPA: MlaD family protein [Victivallales bacterium]|nr:MlaD family protein [Victivallales bacterium]